LNEEKRRRKKRQPTLEHVQLETETAELENFLGETNSNGEGSPLQEQSDNEPNSDRPAVLTEEGLQEQHFTDKQSFTLTKSPLQPAEDTKDQLQQGNSKEEAVDVDVDEIWMNSK
jgi:hypothetical protein